MTEEQIEVIVGMEIPDWSTFGVYVCGMDVSSLGIYGKSHISGIFYLETINIGLVLV